METKIKNIPDAGNSLSSLKSTCYNQKEITKYYSLGKTYGKSVTSDYAYEIGIKFACKKRSEVDKKTMDCDKEVSTLMKSFSNKKEIEAFKNKVK